MKEIEAYLNNTLAPTEKQAFEERMQQEASLKEAVETALQNLMRDYFSQELTEAEKAAIEQRIKEEVIFKNAFQTESKLEADATTLSNMQYWLDNYENVKDIFEKNRDELLKIYNPSAKVVDIRPELSESRDLSGTEGKVKSIRWQRPLVFALAACLVLILLINLGRNSYSSSSLSQKYFLETGAPDAGITLGTDTYEEGLEAFDQENYQEAISLLTQIPDTSDKYALSRYLIGYSHLQTDNVEEAINMYEQIIADGADSTSPFFGYMERSRWFLSLAYLQTGKEAKAKVLLKKIVEDQDHYKHTSAVELLKDLNHFLH